jgi:type I restriction enzyme R subunit
MTRITENIIEAFAIELLTKLGYDYVYAPEIAPDAESPERDTFGQVLLEVPSMYKVRYSDFKRKLK